jgi:hypothetical protein
MARKQFHVSPDGTTWKLTLDGVTLSRHETKDVAVDAGVARAKQNQPSQLIIHLSNGRVEDERTYGDDPYPPRG